MARQSFLSFYNKAKDDLFESIWINESFKTAKQVFSQDNDPSEVDDVLSQFKELSQTGKIKLEDKDITKWMKRPFSALKELVDQAKQVRSGKEIRAASKKDAITLGQYGDWKVIIPLSEPASCYYGKGTKWCTSARDDNYFNSYFGNGITLIYFINKSTNEKLAVAVPSNPDSPIECFDARDNSIFQSDIVDETGIDKNTINELINKARNHEGVTDHRQKAVYQKFVDGYNEVMPEAEAFLSDTHKIYNDPHAALAIATRLSNLNGPGWRPALGPDRFSHLLNVRHGLDRAIDLNRFAKLIMSYYANNYYNLYDYKKILAEIINKRDYEKYVPKDIRDALVDNLVKLQQKAKEKAP